MGDIFVSYWDFVFGLIIGFICGFGWGIALTLLPAEGSKDERDN